MARSDPRKLTGQGGNTIPYPVIICIIALAVGIVIGLMYADKVAKGHDVPAVPHVQRSHVL